MDIINAIIDGRLEHLTPKGMIVLSIIDVVLAFCENACLAHVLPPAVNPMDYMNNYLKDLTFRWLWMIGIFYFFRRAVFLLTSTVRNIGLLAVGMFACILIGVLISPIVNFVLHLAIGFAYVYQLFLIICAVGAILEVLFVFRSPPEVTVMMSFWVILLIVHSIAHFLVSKLFNTNKFAEKRFTNILSRHGEFMFV
ncbi:unnamed protein product [Orchesella dallaii]|uniref:Uncharacterized protein n=1 Tax=Orchesella dallaii TaxID=48710 RepID=A0ABP1RC91_9HEXA